jgi:pimeloyl-ACP methyl ester carboxylesterase
MHLEDSAQVKKFTAFALLAFVCLLVPCHYAIADTPDIHVETGTLDGASYRIDMPSKWNGILIVYYHGYSEHPVVFDKDKPNDLGSGFAAAGFAFAQSGYSVAGWAVEQALSETEALRRYTIAHYGQPKETYVTGHSMGGMLTMATIESYPNRYDGALALCGLLEPATWALERAGAIRAAFDYYYPGLLPGPIGIPASFQFDKELVDKVLKAIPSNPTGQAELMALGHFKTLEDLADSMAFGGFVLRDMEQKIGASIVDNHNFIYAGGPDDNALNDGVKRYAASDAAFGYLKTWYTPTGVLTRPMLAVHTTYDPLIAPESVSVYADLVQRMGSSRNFVQQYVKADGHCHISGPETMKALDELIQWKHTGAKPEGGAVPAN